MAASTDTKKTTTSKELLYVQPNKIHKDLLIANISKHPSQFKDDTSRQTFKMENSSILDRVKGFIPKIATANEELSSITPEEKENFNIENISNNDNVIEMNIAMVDPDLLISDEDTDSSSDEEEEINCSTKKGNITEVKVGT